MKFADINKRYTEIVNEYIVQGYTINTATMSGSQGEVAKVDLTDGNEIIRILIDGFSDWSRDVQGYEIIVGKASSETKPNSNSYWHTIWNDKLDIVLHERFYQADSRNNMTDYYISEAEALEAARIRRERYLNRCTKLNAYTPSEKAMAVAKKVVKSKLGVKRINDADIGLTKTKSGYHVTYRNKAYHLH